MYQPSYHSYNNHHDPGTPPSAHRPSSNHRHHQQDYYDDTTSEIYIDSTYHGPPVQQRPQGGGPPPPPPPRVSRSLNNPGPPQQQHQQQQSHLSSHHQTTRPVTPMSIRTGNARTPSEYSSVSKAKSKTRGGVVIETMSAPNPCCPDSKGVCCILLLVNLGLLLVTLGFSIVLQLFEPPFVWYCGLLFLIVGFISLIVSLLFCMRICSYSRWSSSSYRSNSSIGGGGGAYSRDREPSELYWTHHWQKRINLPASTRNSSTPHEHSDMVYHTQQHRAVSSSS